MFFDDLHILRTVDRLKQAGATRILGTDLLLEVTRGQSVTDDRDYRNFVRELDMARDCGFLTFTVMFFPGEIEPPNPDRISANYYLQRLLGFHLTPLGRDRAPLPRLRAGAARAGRGRWAADHSAFDPDHPHDLGIPFLSRFALRYGTLRQRDDDTRLPEVRAAFNSPFRPFILATTSVGQEGIDFHWWCHAIVHWNSPPNPVDFEQREGRVNRYKGHAIRRNVGAAHRADALRAADRDPWKAAFAAAAARRPPGATDLFPYWAFPGPTEIERHIPLLPLSRDRQRYQQVRDTLTLYRLAFGQPRQEDLIDLLRPRAKQEPADRTHVLVNLAPALDESSLKQ